MKLIEFSRLLNKLICISYILTGKLGMLTFIAKLFLSNALTIAFEWLLLNYLSKPEFIKYIPIPVTLIILPFQFLVFNRIFIKKQIKK